MLIRVARDEDWEGCLEVDSAYETEFAWQMDEHHSSNEWQVSFREIHLPRVLRIQTTTNNEGQLKSWQNRDQFWVALEQREVIGYLGLDIDTAQYQARISDFAVKPQHRRQSVATEMLARATQWCLRQHIYQLILACPLKAHPAISFALSQHFTFCGFQDAYWPGQEVALFFRQKIR